ncbi:AAA family ATPase [Pseudorhodobacter wandonensis]|uniref:AAA family ATPase n=1 Tax=Pseudorhodobacter wandonensis TaxID=1120568 RepID=UPI00067E3772|nr:AAA family ATPase [Pseudorhodobacter wandonensis]
MQLKNFQILNFRSINDSGEIDVSRITALLGRNESGKSNLLRGLHSLNPASGFAALNPIKDFPRHRKLTECNDSTPVVKSVWSLNPKEQAELEAIWPRAKGVKEVRVGRSYNGKTHTVGIDAPVRDFDHGEVGTKVRKIVAAVKAKASELDEGPKNALVSSAETFQKEIGVTHIAVTWATAATPALATLRQALAKADVELSDAQDQHIVNLEELAEQIPEDEAAHVAARKWIIQKLPVFMFLEDYPEIEGHQDISAFLQRRTAGTKTSADINFEKLCKVAGLDPEQLQSLSSSNDQETRSQLANRAGSVVTTAIRGRWKDRQLKVRFNLDAHHFDTLVSDPNSTYDVEVNLDERSRGFQWFFAFYIVFAADTDGGEADNAILLLDEPGLYLHAKSQSDLLRHLEDDFSNQIVYTTHSPFMVPTHHLDWVRTVNIAEDSGTTVSNDPTGDARTLFPLQAALGYDLAQSLFVGPHNLIVEGVTDFWVVSAISEYLNDCSGKGLHRDLTITPAGGAQKVHYMVALLTSEQLNVLVLLDDEKDAKTTRDDLVKGKLIRDDNVVFVSSAFDVPPPKEADIEDILDPATYEALVRESYRAELKGKTLKLNPNIPRIAKRVEMAFDELGIPFHKTRPTRLLLKKVAEDAPAILTKETLDRFEKLFATINEAFTKHVKRADKPFT